MRVVRDVLDNQLVDREQRKIGKVDGIVLRLEDGQPPRLAYIETGGPALARRLHPRLGRWAAALGRRLGRTNGQPLRIPWAAICDVGIDVEVDLDGETTAALAWEHWLREHIVRHIPGAG